MDYGDTGRSDSEEWMVYKRTSTLVQAERGSSMDTQDENCRKRAAELGYTWEPKFDYTETESGAFMDRPALEQMLEVVRQGKVGLAVVHDADRLARDPRDLLNIIKIFSDAGVRIEFVNGPSPDSPEGELLMFLMGWAGKTERNLIKRRTMEGKEKAANSGRMPQGFGKGIYGYEYDPVTKRRTIHEAEAAVVRTMYQWAAEGVTANAIAVRLNELHIPSKTGKRWSRAAVVRVLTNTAYYGLDHYGKYRHVKIGPKKVEITKRPTEEAILIWGFTPLIISRELHDRVQEQLKVRQARNKKKGTPYLLTGKMKCGLCGSSVVGIMSPRGTRYYRCRGAFKQPERDTTCKALSIRAEIEQVVWDTLADAIRNPDILSREVLRHMETGGGNLEEEVRKYRREIEANKREERRLITLFQKEFIDQDILESLVAPLKLLRDEKERALQILEEQQKRKDAAAGAKKQIAEHCQQMSDHLDNLDYNGKRATLAAFRIIVVATKEAISITVVIDPSVTTTGTSSP